MTTRSEGRVPEVLPDRACEEQDLFRDYVGEGREYRGHNGDCGNCGATFEESEDSDLSTAHWMHRKAVAHAIWERDTPQDVRELAKVMDPDDPMEATKHAERYLSEARCLPTPGPGHGSELASPPVPVVPAEPEAERERLVELVQVLVTPTIGHDGSGYRLNLTSEQAFLLSAAIATAGYLSPSQVRARERAAAAKALREAEFEIRDAKSIPVTVRAAICAVLRGRADRIEAGGDA